MPSLQESGIMSAKRRVAKWQFYDVTTSGGDIMPALSYHEQMDLINIKKIRELQKDLPEFAGYFFRAMEIKKATNTRRNYAYDLSTFFYFLKTENPYFQNKDIRTLPVSVLDDLQPVDIEEYLSFLTYYEKDGQVFQNHAEGKARKLATLNTFFGYFHKKEMIQKNAPSVVDVPRIKEKNIIRMDANEVAQLIDNIESGEKLSKTQKVWHNKNKLRDLAIVVTLLGTGVRVTELVGLDISDLDFDNGAMRVIRKGGNEDIVYFGEEAEEMLRNYMDERLTMEPEPGHENALFISQKNTRITVRSVERLVKKYASTATAKKITPHKLRSTYGTALYQETGDIYLVADVLGHKNVNTTRKHYAAMKEENKRKAAQVVQLREK